MKSFRYRYLLSGILLWGVAIFCMSINFDAVSDLIENGLTKTSESKYQGVMLIFDFGYLMPLYIGLMFAVGGTICLKVFVRDSIFIRRNNRIKQFGRDGIGTYLKHKEIIKVGEKDNETPYYEIHFSFENDSGKIIETKTSGSVFSICKAEALALMKTFPIRYMGDNAVIITDNISSKKE